MAMGSDGGARVGEREGGRGGGGPAARGGTPRQRPPERGGGPATPAAAEPLWGGGGGSGGGGGGLSARAHGVSKHQQLLTLLVYGMYAYKHNAQHIQ